MLPGERRRRIVDYVTTENGCSVTELAEEFGVSKATIRRDLRQLAAEDRIERSHGGALPTTTVGQEEAYTEKEVTNLDAKRAIGERAVEELTEASVVFFDAGTTTMEAAKQVSEDHYGILATNAPPIALELEPCAAEVKLSGGRLRERTRALVGPTGEKFLERTNFDLAFVGTNGVDPEKGLTTPDEAEAEMKRLSCRAAQRVVVLTDGSKFGKRSFVSFAGLGDVDALVTDREPPDPVGDALDDAGVTVEVVSP